MALVDMMCAKAMIYVDHFSFTLNTPHGCDKTFKYTLDRIKINRINIISVKTITHFIHAQVFKEYMAGMDIRCLSILSDAEYQVVRLPVLDFSRDSQ